MGTYLFERQGRNVSLTKYGEIYLEYVKEALSILEIGEKKLRKLVSDNLDSGFIIQNGVKFLIKRKRFEDFLNDLTAI